MIWFPRFISKVTRSTKVYSKNLNMNESRDFLANFKVFVDLISNMRLTSKLSALLTRVWYSFHHSRVLQSMQQLRHFSSIIIFRIHQNCFSLRASFVLIVLLHSLLLATSKWTRHINVNVEICYSIFDSWFSVINHTSFSNVARSHISYCTGKDSHSGGAQSSVLGFIQIHRFSFSCSADLEEWWLYFASYKCHCNVRYGYVNIRFLFIFSREKWKLRVFISKPPVSCMSLVSGISFMRKLSFLVWLCANAELSFWDFLISSRKWKWSELQVKKF